MTISETLPLLEQAVLKLNFGQKPANLYDPLYYIMQLGGKRLRPYLCLLGYDLYKNNWQSIINEALSVEVFHNFTLLHDDIMDQAPTRRGKPTVHKVWSEPVAILAGDVMLVRAYEMLFNVPSDKLKTVLQNFSQTAAEVCEGQQMDMDFETTAHVTKENYIEMIRLKTSVLLGYALQLGAILANAPDKDAKILYQVGVDAGIGFQIMDDILDVYGDPAKFGKQVGGDILSNKKTYMLLLAQEQATGNIAANLNEWLSKTNFDPIEKVAAVTQIYDKLGIKQQVEQIMKSYFDKAFKNLKNLSVPIEKTASISAFLNELIQREN